MTLLLKRNAEQESKKVMHAPTTTVTLEARFPGATSWVDIKFLLHNFYCSRWRLENSDASREKILPMDLRTGPTTPFPLVSQLARGGPIEKPNEEEIGLSR